MNKSFAKYSFETILDKNNECLNLPKSKTYCYNTRFKFCFVNVKFARLKINFWFNIKNVY